MGFSAQDCLVIEDAPAGIASARNAGMQVIAVPTTYPAEELADATVIVPSLTGVEVQVFQDSLQIKIDAPIL